MSPAAAAARASSRASAESWKTPAFAGSLSQCILFKVFSIEVMPAFRPPSSVTAVRQRFATSRHVDATQSGLARAIGSNECTVDDITRSVPCFFDESCYILGRMPAQRFGERLPVLRLESVFAEKRCLAPARPMCCRKQVADNLVLYYFRFLRAR